MKNIIKTLKENKVIVLFLFLFVVVLMLVYFFSFISKSKGYDEDRNLGDIQTPVDDLASEFKFEDSMVYIARDASITEWPTVNKVFKIVDLGSSLDIYSIANKFGLNEKGTDDTFEEWLSDWGSLIVYNETIRIEVINSDVRLDVNKIQEESTIDSYLNDELSKLLGYDFESVAFKAELFEDSLGESIIKVEGVYKIDDFSILYDGWTDNFVTIILNEAGTVTYLQVKRFIPNTEEVGTYSGYTQDELFSNMKSFDIDDKIFKVNIDLGSSGSYESDGSYAYLIDVKYGELDVKTITIDLMKMTYYVDHDSGTIIPMIVVSGDMSVGTGGGVKSGLYRFEIWHSNITN